MAGNHHPQAPTPTTLPENDQSHLCGYYFDQRNESSVVHVPSAQDDFWFQSQVRSRSAVDIGPICLICHIPFSRLVAPF